MLKWFRRGPSPHQTALAMIGARAGDRVILAGSPEPALAAEVARITGLNGRTLVISATPETDAALQAAAADAGALIDLERTFPAGESANDVAVLAISTGEVPQAALVEAYGALRSGGRLILITGTRRAGVFAGKTDVPPPNADATVQLLIDAGGRAARRLATAEGVSYYEARK
jgi:hypothetical protein